MSTIILIPAVIDGETVKVVVDDPTKSPFHGRLTDLRRNETDLPATEQVMSYNLNRGRGG